MNITHSYKISPLSGTKRAGFTLIELSIVLVIIGLIIGGVLVGQDMYDTVKTRKLIQQMEQVEVAVRTFKLKYNCLPGDCEKANDFGLGTSGDGNKVLLGPHGNSFFRNNSTSIAQLPISDPSQGIAFGEIKGEFQYFWVHLSNAGLIPGTYPVLTDSSDDDNLTELKQYFPVDSMNKSVLYAFSWGGRLYIRTGLNATSVFSTFAGNGSSLTSLQMQNISDAYGLNLVIGNNTFESMWAPNQKITPIGRDGFPSTMWHAILPNNNTACAVSDGSGGYQYNIADNGLCNVMYRIDH